MSGRNNSFMGFFLGEEGDEPAVEVTAEEDEVTRRSSADEDESAKSEEADALRVVASVVSSCASESHVHELANEEGHEMTKAGKDYQRSWSCEYKDGNWICQPYKREKIQLQMENNSPGSARRTALVGTLRDMGVKVFIIDGVKVGTTEDILKNIKRVIGFVARENRALARSSGPLGFQRCLLYQDHQGRLFNLLLASHAVGPASKWQDYLDTFSGLEAMIALTVLSRSFPCAVSDDDIESLKPAYLSLILGLVLTEEISLSWLNTSMLVRAAPSVSAHTITSKIGSDLLRKAIVLCLALASAASGTSQKALTLFGITTACMVLLSNLGSRAWFFLGWKPFSYQGPGAPFLAYMASVLTGIFFPYMGHRKISIGGKAAMEYILTTALIVAVVFVASDVDQIQKFLIVGSETCNQDYVNVAVGGWWAAALLSSVLLVRSIPFKDQYPLSDAEPLLIEDHASPVGYKVPSVPDFEIDPGLSDTGSACVPLKYEIIAGVVMSIVIGAGIIYLGFTDADEDLVGQLEELVEDAF